MMLRIIILILAIVAFVVPAEIRAKSPLENNAAALQPDLKLESVGKHALFKKQARPDLEPHPVYRSIEEKNEGRARIELVKSDGAVIKSDMLNDQPAPVSAPVSTEVNRIDNVQVPNYGFVPVQLHPEVAYPDIPYAPGYSYDNAYAPSNSYDVYGNGLSTYYPDSEPSTFSLLWSQVPNSRTMINYVGRTIVWFINSAFVLALGSFLTVALCSYTNLCTIIFHGVGPIHEEMRALVTPERLEKISNAADFVKNAIDKYQKIQGVTDAVRARRSVFLNKP